MRGVPRERARDHRRAVRIELDAEEVRRPVGDRDQVAWIVEVEPEGDPETVPQWRAESPGAGGGADDCEAVEREPQGLRARPLAGDEVEGEVLHGRVERLLHRAVQAVHLVDEEDVALVQAREDRGEHALVLERGPAREAGVDPHLDGDDLGERGLAEPGWAVEQHVVERVPALPGGLDEDAHLVLDRSLADEIVETAGAKRGVGHALGLEFLRADHPLVGHVSSRRSAAPTSSATSRGAPSTAIAATALRASVSRNPRPTSPAMAAETASFSPLAWA